MTYRKKLIEVALPLASISEAASREKTIHTGVPANLHTWWSRKPLAACRAVLFASLVDDPDSDPMFAGDEDIAASKRAELFNLIEELVLWENSNNPRVINRARAEIARCVATQKIEEGVFKKDDIVSLPSPNGRGAGGEGGTKATKIKVSVFEIHQLLAKPEQVNAFLAEYAPPVLDPFCGGGSIPLEGQRLGLCAYASDLNPVAVLITKALIEIPPRFAGLPPVNPAWQKKSKEEKAATVWQGAQGLAEDVRYYGKWMRDEAEKRIGQHYPKITITKEMAKDRPDLKRYIGQLLPITAWIWARSVKCQNPACGAMTPLANKFWLSTHKGNEAWAKIIVDSSNKSVHFKIAIDGVPPEGTVNRAGAICAVCRSPVDFEHIRTEGSASRIAHQLMSTVVAGTRKRLYLDPVDSMSLASDNKAHSWKPDTDIPAKALGFRVHRYGMTKHSDLFTERQMASLSTFSDLVEDARTKVVADGGCKEYADAIAAFLAISVNRLAQTNNTLVRWLVRKSGTSKGTPAFDRQIVSMVWEFAEGNVFGDSVGSWAAAIKNPLTAINAFPQNAKAGIVLQADAAQRVIVESPVVSTDPPYFDSIGYADLSDFYYIWLRKALRNIYPDLFKTVLVPKQEEIIAAPHLFNGDWSSAERHFLGGLHRAFCLLREKSNQAYPLTVYYAFKQKEEEGEEDSLDHPVVSSTGWETMLEAMLRAGFSITGTWPLRTESKNRLRAISSNALASSILLVCKTKSSDATLATRREFLATLNRELPDALRQLQQCSIAPVDLAQAAIGPGMAVFSRYSNIMESDGSAMTVRTALGLINQALDEVLAEQEGEFDGDTRWALAWFEQFGMEEGPFGVAETLSKAKNTSVGGLVEAGFLQAQSGKVRLLRREELDAKWDPATDKRLTMWEVTQHLIRKLEQEGESGAAVLVHKLGGMAEAARDLAYRLYSICERKKWATEALSYNGLVIAWPELTKLAIGERSKAPEKQSEMF